MKTGCLTLALMLLTSAGAIADWPRFRGTNGNGIVGDKLQLLAKPKELWTTSVGSGNASLIIQDGKLYTMGHLGRRGPLVCLDAATGKLIWDKPADCYYSNSSPAVTKDRGFLLGTQGKKTTVYCFQLSDGKTIWRKQLPEQPAQNPYGQAGSPLLWRDLVILNVGAGIALKQATGEIAWEHRGLSGLATPVLYREKDLVAVMIFAGEALVARDATTGRELWNIPWKTDGGVNACDPIYHEGKVFINTGYGKYAALFDVTVSPPRQIWREHGSSFSNGFFYQGYLYCFARSEFVCLDFQTGKRQWTVPRAGSGSAMLAGDKILLLDDRGGLHVAPVSPQAFRPTLQATVHGGTTWTPPSLVDGKLFVRNKDGEAVCLQIGE